MNEASDRDVVLFSAAVLLAPGERAAYLARACDGEEALRARVEVLLRAHEQVGDFLTTAPAGAVLAVTRGQLQPAYPFFQCCKALAEYRQGRFEAALKWAQRAAATPFPYTQAEASAILAMSQCQLHQVDDARVAFAKCEKIVQTQLPPLGGCDLGGDWRDWIIAHALLTEARSLIEVAATAEGTSAKP